MNPFTISRACPRDAAAVISLRKEAEKWLSNQGVTQWTNTSRGIEDIQEHIASGCTYVVRSTGPEIAASITLDKADPDFWTEQEMLDPAIYLYKFMIGEGFRGTGLGDAMLDWACQTGERQGAEELRLDCWRTNDALHRYYLARGFRHLATRSAEGRMSGALFSRPTSLRLARPSQVQIVERHA